MATQIPAPLSEKVSGEHSIVKAKPDQRQQVSVTAKGSGKGHQLLQLPFAEETDEQPTIPMIVPDGNFRPLPEGALLGDEMYYIASIRSESPGCNIYGVEETQPVFPCPSPDCGHLENPSGSRVCLSCGMSLDDVMAVHRRHQLYEYRDFSDVAMVAHIAELGLSHPRLLLYPYFAERPYGVDDRYYLVLPDPTPMLASKISLPQKAARVLDWGHQLANALAYLHAHNIGWQTVSPDHIALRERHAMWVDFSTVRILAPNKGEATRQKAQDVTGLTHILFHLATAQEGYQPDTSLPKAAIEVFERVLGSQADIAAAEALAEALKDAVIAIRRPTTFRLRVGRHTDVGGVRDLNEDSLLVLELDRVHRSISQPVGLFVVADGMGGHAAGDIASGLAINAMARKMATDLLGPQLSGDLDAGSFDARDWLAEAVQTANMVVHTHRESARTNMGTTLVAALLIGNRAHIANVGDSRAYLVTKNDGLRQITTDHSLVERLIALGQIRPDEARIHPQRNVIYRTIGDQQEAEIDLFVQELNPGDSLLLCSDGLSGKVDDAEIWQLVSRSQSPQEACELLVQAANDHGGDDNITVIVIQATR
jgi:protein phosphatase